MDINERIRIIREDTGLSQKDFGVKLGIKQGGVSWLEQPGHTVTDQRIIQICDIFGVSEKWLRNGEGEKYLPNDVMLLNKMAEVYGLSDSQKEALAIIMSFPDDTREKLASAFFSLRDSIRAADNQKAPPEEAAHRKAITDVKRKMISQELDDEEKGQIS